ncbi:MAG: RNA polymerase sigma factor, partial [Nannocystaceae bacterium]
MLRALDHGRHRLALKLMMQAYGSIVLARCRQLLRPDHSAAEDVRQVVFVQAYRDLERYERRSSIRGWLLAIARNRCIDHARKRGRSLAVDCGVDATEMLERLPTSAEQPEYALARATTAQHLEDCLHRLQPAV